MAFLVLVPVLSFGLLFLILVIKQSSVLVFDRIRIGVLHAFIAISLFIVIVSEGLSFFSILRFGVLLAVWTVAFVALCAMSIYYRAFNSVKLIFSALKGLSGAERLFVVVIAVLLSISLIVALAYPVNNFDSMTYHMARVGYWEQNHNISHYKTHILRQLEFGPLAELYILHFQILTGNDRFANSVQLFFFGGCILLVSLLSKQFKANRRQQMYSALFAAFIPMAVLESNTTQNDIVVSFFVLAFVFFTVKLFSKAQWKLVCFSGMSLGLAWYTKGSGYLFTAVFCGWYILLILIRYRLKVGYLLRRALLYATIPIVAVIINCGLFYRNIFLSGSVMGNEGKETTNAGHEIKPLTLVAIKNIMNNLPVSGSIKKKVANKAWDMGINPDDPDYSLSPMNQMIEGFSFHEDYAQNFPHLILVALAFVIFFTRKSVYTNAPDRYFLFVISLAATAILFAVLLKWQPWSNRLLTPLFLLCAVLIGIESDRIHRSFLAITAGFVVIYGFVALCYSYRHPILPFKRSLVSRNLNYNDFIFDKPKLDLKRFLDSKPYSTIGLYITADSWDYVYYKLLRNKGSEKRVLRHVFVNNASNMYMDAYIPDVIISLEQSVSTYNIRGKEYRRTAIFGENVIFEPVN